MAKILVVEDESLLQKLYGEALTAAGFEVVVASDGNNGLAKIKEGGFALILLDVMLPGIDGITVLSELKKANIPHAPIVVMTNLTGKELIEKAVSLGAISCVDKTEVKAEKMVETVKEVLAKTVPL